MIELPVTPGRADGETEQPAYVGPGVFRHIEIQINTACDCACFGCDRMSDVVTDSNMTVAQVRRFVDESLDLKWEWERVRVLGGEPTLHPQLNEIIEQLMHYRRFYSKCFLQLLSNGRGKLWKPCPWQPDTSIHDWLCDRGVDPHVEGKEPGVTPAWFSNTRIAPIDRDPNVGGLEPCGIFGIRGCGIGLTRHGFFLDGAGAAIARVAGLDVGKQHLKDVTWESMWEQAKVLCHLCGHWNPCNWKDRTAKPEAIVTKKVSETGEVTGPWWSAKIATYNRSRPEMTLYGSS